MFKGTNVEKDGLFEESMSYRRHRVNRRALQGTVEDYARTVGGALTAANEILKDPALPEVTMLVIDIHRAQPPTTPGGAPSPGIGLKDIVPPLKAYRYYTRNKWVLPVAIAAIVGVPFLFGYMAGRR